MNSNLGQFLSVSYLYTHSFEKEVINATDTVTKLALFIREGSFRWHIFQEDGIYGR